MGAYEWFTLRTPQGGFVCKRRPNDHVGKVSSEYERVCGCYRYGVKNKKGNILFLWFCNFIWYHGNKHVLQSGTNNLISFEREWNNRQTSCVPSLEG